MNQLRHKNYFHTFSQIILQTGQCREDVGRFSTQVRNNYQSNVNDFDCCQLDHDIRHIYYKSLKYTIPTNEFSDMNMSSDCAFYMRTQRDTNIVYIELRHSQTITGTGVGLV